MTLILGARVVTASMGARFWFVDDGTVLIRVERLRRQW